MRWLGSAGLGWGWAGAGPGWAELDRLGWAVPWVSTHLATSAFQPSGLPALISRRCPWTFASSGSPLPSALPPCLLSPFPFPCVLFLSRLQERPAQRTRKRKREKPRTVQKGRGAGEPEDKKARPGPASPKSRMRRNKKATQERRQRPGKSARRQEASDGETREQDEQRKKQDAPATTESDTTPKTGQPPP